MLEKINFPEDLKKFNISDLPSIAKEIREFIISTVSTTGGHLAASLGTVELILVLTYIFNPPKDKIIFDVGHQAYAYKILTGRKEKFHSLRQYSGISGFPNRDESEYDIVTVGHAGTAVSAALGIAVARDLKNENYKVIAIIGDGSLSCGLTYEGLNNAGHLNKDIIVVLNDNAMFISHRVGAIAKMLVRILTLGLVKKFEKKIENFFRRLHYFGAYLLRVAKRFKLLFFPGMLFEEMGFAYIGPVDGHDINELYRVFNNVRHFKGPILVHIVTKKGKGYEPAEKNPIKFHNVPKFDIKTGTLYSSEEKITFTKVFGETITKLAEKNENLVGITAAMTDGCGLEKFAELYPERFFDVGIAEEHAVTFSSGLAIGGFIPVCAIYSTFLQRSFDQILHDVALPNLHIIFAVDRAGIVGEDGPTHHGLFDLSYMRLVPNMVIMVPKDGTELKDMLYTAIETNAPVMIRYPKGYIVDQEKFNLDNFNIIPIGKNEIVVDIENADIVIFSCGPLVYDTIKVASLLPMKTGVVNYRFIKPIDEDLLKNITCDKIVTIENNTLIGGLYSSICEFYAKEKIKKQILGIGIPDKFVPFGNTETLKQVIGLNFENIIKRIKEFFGI